MKILILALLLFLGSQLYSQGNLQFNQVLTYNGSTTNGPIWSVPAGKVWKVENIMILGSGGVSVFKVNGNQIFNSFYGPWQNNLFWLKANDNFQFQFQYAQEYFISIIEFNIIP